MKNKHKGITGPHFNI